MAAITTATMEAVTIPAATTHAPTTAPTTRAYYPDYYQRRVYYPPRGSVYRQGYRDGYRDAYYGSRYYNDITCTQRLQEAGRC